MNEIEYRLEHAQWCHHRFLKEGLDCQWQWCESIGLWETSIWTYNSSIISYKLMQDLNPGHRGE